jgi:hypothetical protein
MSKEKWIEDILQTPRHIQPAGVHPFMAARVEAVLRQGGKTASPARMPLKWVYVSAAAMAALLVLNVLAWKRPAPEKHSGIQAVMQEYGWSNQRFYATDF